MEHLHFKIQILAPVARVFQTLIAPQTFSEWTGVFSPTSYFEGTWEKDSKMRFVSTDENGNLAGALSRIKEYIPNQLICIEHYGMIQNGEEITEGETVAPLLGALETYTFISQGEHTELQVDTEAFTELKDYFLQTWPQAITKLKQICERS